MKFWFLIPLLAGLFAIFPLTDTDIWWHLACAREWVTTWTPVREPVVNVHEYFQAVVGFVYGVGGAPLLVAFKAVLWAAVFALFLRKNANFILCAILLFIFRYQFEMRPVVFTLLFLGLYRNLFPKIFENSKSRIYFVCIVLLIQFVWCKFQGLYILGPLYASALIIKDGKRELPLKVGLVAALFAMPFAHGEGLLLFAYPVELLNRLLGASPSAAVFASEISENRSPVSLLLKGENPATSALMIVIAVVAICYCARNFRQLRAHLPLMATAILALVAERNFVLLLPLFLSELCDFGMVSDKLRRALFDRVQPAEKRGLHFSPGIFCGMGLLFIFGLWGRSLMAYDGSMIASQRVPVAAARWMQAHPHEGRLFNDDRAGGYLALVNPTEPTFIDGRFILKTADFFERYLSYADCVENFLADADAFGMDRALFPTRYYARWGSLLKALNEDYRWRLVYSDDYFVVFDKVGQ